MDVLVADALHDGVSVVYACAILVVMGTFVALYDAVCASVDGLWSASVMGSVSG